MNTVWIKQSATKRLFLAIPITQQWQHALIEVQKEFRNTHITGTIPTRWTAPENFHITVGFIGSVEEKDVFHIISTIRLFLRDAAAFRLSFYRFEMATRHEPKMIWARFVATKKFREIVRICNHALTIRNGHAVIPHVTVARLKGEMHHSGKLETSMTVPKELPVTSLVLYESKTLPTGSVYRTIATFRL